MLKNRGIFTLRYYSQPLMSLIDSKSDTSAQSRWSRSVCPCCSAGITCRPHASAALTSTACCTAAHRTVSSRSWPTRFLPVIRVLQPAPAAQHVSLLRSCSDLVLQSILNYLITSWQLRCECNQRCCLKTTPLVPLVKNLNSIWVTVMWV